MVKIILRVTIQSNFLVVVPKVTIVASILPLLTISLLKKMKSFQLKLMYMKTIVEQDLIVNRRIVAQGVQMSEVP